MGDLSKSAKLLTNLILSAGADRIVRPTKKGNKWQEAKQLA
jgi:hypothetical protein